MSTADPIALLFAGMEKLGPGGDDETRHALGLLPTRDFRVVVDAGCGTGRQTIVLAKELRTRIHAVDVHQPFLDELARRARDAKLAHLVEPHCMNMQDIPAVFREIDLLWSEGAAYNIGFANALAVWRPALVPGGFAVISELSWLKAEAPDAVTVFFRSCYPDMQSVEQNTAIALRAGYKVLATFTLPRECWMEDYYDVLAPRARSLLNHEDRAVRDFAAETLREIEVFEQNVESYGYVFYALQRTR